jgi:hypothetical protein
MKFATYRSVGFNYRGRRPTFKPQKTEESIGSDEGATIQPPKVESIPEQKPLVYYMFSCTLPRCSKNRSGIIIIIIPTAIRVALATGFGSIEI